MPIESSYHIRRGSRETPTHTLGCDRQGYLSWQWISGTISEDEIDGDCFGIFIEALIWRDDEISSFFCDISPYLTISDTISTEGTRWSWCDRGDSDIGIRKECIVDSMLIGKCRSREREISLLENHPSSLESE